MAYQIIASSELTEETVSAIVAPLAEYNLQNAPPPNFTQLALCIQDGDGKILGGLWGRVAYDWLFVEYVVVPEPLRGQGIGSDLMRKAEDFARDKDCVGVWLDTFSFQALPFYEKLGYSQFGQIDDHPRGSIRYFLQKRLVTLAS